MCGKLGQQVHAASTGDSVINEAVGNTLDVVAKTSDLCRHESRRCQFTQPCMVPAGP
jgi:hypothetical protein